MTDRRSWALFIDDHPMCREAARIALESIDPALAVTVVGTLAEAIATIRVPGPVIICLDLSLPDSDGFAGLLALQRVAGAVPIIVVSGQDRQEIARRAFDLDAAGFLSKAEKLTTMIDAFHAVLSGERWFPDDVAIADRAPGTDPAARLRDLTTAQRRVLDAMAGGRQNKQIAYDLGLSEITVKAHVKQILRKLGVVNRTQAILLDRTLTVDRALPSVDPKG